MQYKDEQKIVLFYDGRSKRIIKRISDIEFQFRCFTIGIIFATSH